MKNDTIKGFALAVIICFCILTMGADRIKTGFWNQTNQRVPLTEIRNGASTTYVKTRFCADRPTVFIYNEFSNIAADTRGIVIDLSDTTGYSHGDTGYITLHDMLGTMCIDGATGKWDIHVGLLTEVDATNGSVYWFWGMSIRGPDRTCESITYRPIKNINMLLDGTTPLDWSTGQSDLGSTDWQTDVALATYIGGSTAPGAGDIVVYFQEIENGSTLHIKGMQLQYASHSN